MSPEEDAIRGMEPGDFVLWWKSLTDDQRSQMPEGFLRYRELVPEVGATIARLDRQIRKHKGNGNGEWDESPPPAELPTWPAPLDLEYLAENEPQPPAFIIEDWLPCGYATLLAGHGGVGKSAIALHLAVCLAAGIPFFGKEVRERKRVLYLSCEDRKSLLHWRLWRICAHLRQNLSQLRGWLDILDLVGFDTILIDRNFAGAFQTYAYNLMCDRMAQQITEFLIVDGVNDTYGGNTASPSDIKKFVNSLVAKVPPDTGAVLLAGHVNKPSSTAGAAGDGYLGPTAWHNAVRARWYLYPETIEDEESKRVEHTGRLNLDLQKSNLGKTDQSMLFEWDDDAKLFLSTGTSHALSKFDKAHRDRTEQAGILAAMRACAARSEPVPAATMGRRTAFHVLSVCAEFPDSLRSGRPGIRRFWHQVEILRANAAIKSVELKRNNRKIIDTLVLQQSVL
jgi:hypothetical protein